MNSLTVSFASLHFTSHSSKIYDYSAFIEEVWGFENASNYDTK